jgi:hypothetical protein
MMFLWYLCLNMKSVTIIIAPNNEIFFSCFWYRNQFQLMMFNKVSLTGFIR